MAGRDDPPDADLADPADAAGKRPAGRGRGLGEAESDEVGVVHRRIPNLPDHADQVETRRTPPPHNRCVIDRSSNSVNKAGNRTDRTTSSAPLRHSVLQKPLHNSNRAPSGFKSEFTPAVQFIWSRPGLDPLFSSGPALVHIDLLEKNQEE